MLEQKEYDLRYNEAVCERTGIKLCKQLGTYNGRHVNNYVTQPETNHTRLYTMACFPMSFYLLFHPLGSVKSVTEASFSWRRLSPLREANVKIKG
jgi:hypothetical protein